jgi:hypothetical protein
MDINKILAELRTQKEEIERAIIALERIGGRRRGRPPQWMKAMKKPTQTEPRKKRSQDKEN